MPRKWKWPKSKKSGKDGEPAAKGTGETAKASTKGPSKAASKSKDTKRVTSKATSKAPQSKGKQTSQAPAKASSKQPSSKAASSKPASSKAASKGPTQASQKPPTETADVVLNNLLVDGCVEKTFKLIDTNNSGRLSRNELFEAMNNVSGSDFGKETIIMLYGLFDTDKTGGLDIQEFAQMYKFMEEWTTIFKKLDSRSEGYLVYQELMRALTMLGYRIDQHSVRVLTRKFGRTAKYLELDSFIRICCLLKRLTETFRKKDVKGKGYLTLQYYDVLHMSLSACF